MHLILLDYFWYAGYLGHALNRNFCHEITKGELLEFFILLIWQIASKLVKN